MKFTKRIAVFIFFSIFSIFSFAKPSFQIPQHRPDSIFLQDNPVVSQLDSLVNLTFFKNSTFTTDVQKLNKYKFPADFIPQYSDSVYRERINTLAVRSPFEFVYNEQVKNFIDLYAVKKRNLTSRMLGLAELYFPLFEEQLDKYDVPLELKYLAIIESALNPIAKSRAGATGLWQFMLGTGKLYDLKVTSLVDDRCDPYKSTVAACQHLRDLYSIYKDWALCLAAYNAGGGSVNRAIRMANIDTNENITYWKIQSFLPRETQNYVPAFIAVCYVMNYPAEHNIYPIQPPLLHCDVDSITLTKKYSISQISSFLCLSNENIVFLNPAYKKGIIPATKETPYVLRLPREYMADFIVNQDAIYNYKTPNEINYQAQLEQMSDKKTVNNGNPVPADTKINTQKTSTAFNNASGTNKKFIYHTVQKGDSLWRIASKYTGVSVEDIRRLNNMSGKTTIHPGQKLKIQLKG